jgi:lysophospholipase L1-like esterase
MTRDDVPAWSGRERPRGSALNPLLPLLLLSGVVGVAVWCGEVAPVVVRPPTIQPADGQPPALAAPAVRPNSAASPGANPAEALPVDPLPSWNEGETKQAIVNFLAAVTAEGTATYVPPEERLAVFDHDGTLVCEKPIVHGMFLLEHIRQLAQQRPDLAHTEPYATLLTGDITAVRKLGKRYFMDLNFEALAGVTEEDLEKSVQGFLARARHPAFDVPYAEVTYQPMHELLALLRSRGFTVWICTGSGVHFMRPAAAAWYEIPPENVIASRPALELEEVDPPETLAARGFPARALRIVAKPQLEVLNDEHQKAISIAERIGRRPIFAAGNVGTAGDIAMLRWSAGSPRPNLQLLVLHDDAQREMAYDEPNHASMQAAKAYGWTVVRMASDWNRIFAKPLERSAAEPPQGDRLNAAEALVPADPSALVAPSAAPRALPADRKDRWEEEIAAYEQETLQQPPGPGSVCLLGSSNVRLWSTLAEDFPRLNIVNRGVGGCYLSELAEFAPRLLAHVHPAVVVVSAGGNDIDSGAAAADVATAFQHLVAEMRKVLPEVKILFLEIAPSIKRWEQVETQAEANRQIAAWIEAGNAPGVSHLDTSAAFLGADGLPAAECFLDDTLHPSPIGNSRRAQILQPVLEKLLEH